METIHVLTIVGIAAIVALIYVYVLVRVIGAAWHHSKLDHMHRLMSGRFPSGRHQQRECH